MTEDDARDWVKERFAEHFAQLDAFTSLVRGENERQNLISPSTVSQIWSRHIVDSLQLSQWDTPGGLWADIGTGGGFPGLVIAIVRPATTILVEPRQKRAAFLTGVVQQLGIKTARIERKRAESLSIEAAVISARAVAPLPTVFELGKRWANTKTRWILPRGRLSNDDMLTLKREFGTMFHVEHSVTSSESAIVVADGKPK